MMTCLGRLQWSDWCSSIPAFATVLLIPINFQIAEGIAAGCVLHTLFLVGSGQWRRVHCLLALLSVLFAAKMAVGLFG